MQVPDASIVLDRAQLRDVTLDDEDLMREILAELIDDTSRQMPFLDSAIRAEDSQKCMQLAHYSKGACANVGANAAAAVLKRIEREAASREFPECRASLANLATEIERLRFEAVAIQAPLTRTAAPPWGPAVPRGEPAGSTPPQPPLPAARR